MARLVIQSADNEIQIEALSLKLGVNTVGRGPDNDFRIPHPTLSSRHCELLWANETVRVKDCDSTNGVFVDDEQVSECFLQPGQFLRLGGVELLVESTTAEISVPKLPSRIPAPPIPLEDGSVPCQNHEDARAVFRCGRCGSFFCQACIHQLKVRGGEKALQLCPQCSGHVEVAGDGEPAPKRGVMAFLTDTLRLPFRHNKKKAARQPASRR